MNPAIVRKFARESLASLVYVSSGVIFFVVVFVWAMQSLGPQLMEFLSSVGFLRQMLELAYGIRLSGDVSSNVLYAVAFLHPLVLALSWGFLIATATRTTIGEIESGTADLLLTLPVARQVIYQSATIVWLVGAVLISVCPLIGVYIGSQLFEPTEPIRMQRFFITSVSFYSLNLAIAGLATMIGCLVKRRGHAVAIVIGVALFWVAMNFLEPFLTVVQRIKFLSLLNYYRPADIVRTGVWPLANIATLIGIAFVFWLIGRWHYCRKDIPAP